jgi:hypothetical protein
MSELRKLKHMDAFFEEVWLPFSIVVRLLRGKLSWSLAAWLLETWWPCRKWRRARMRVRLWRQRRYRGADEFHSSYEMDCWSMMQMTRDERDWYLKNLVWRRELAHRKDLTS